MSYTYSITSKGQITIPKEFRNKLGLDRIGKATLQVNDRDEIVITAPKSLSDIRTLLSKPTFKDQPSKREQAMGDELARKYEVN